MRAVRSALRPVLGLAPRPRSSSRMAATSGPWTCGGSATSYAAAPSAVNKWTGVGAKLANVSTPSVPVITVSSTASGVPNVQTPGTSNGQGAPGTLTGGALENSNVDIGTQFTNMVVAQRAFEANSKVVSVEAEVLSTLTNMVRT